jgi:hypothetical protein
MPPAGRLSLRPRPGYDDNQGRGPGRGGGPQRQVSFSGSPRRIQYHSEDPVVTWRRGTTATTRTTTTVAGVGAKDRTMEASPD